MILSRSGHDVTGIDGATQMLETVRNNVRAAGLDAQIFEMDCQYPSPEADTFDLILSRNLTHAFFDHRLAYSQ
jgi:SAM-dependent methyltransferase